MYSYIIYQLPIFPCAFSTNHAQTTRYTAKTPAELGAFGGVLLLTASQTDGAFTNRFS